MDEGTHRDRSHLVVVGVGLGRSSLSVVRQAVRIARVNGSARYGHRQRISNYGKESGANLAVIGAVRWRKPKDRLLGTTADSVARQVDYPVLAVEQLVG